MKIGFDGKRAFLNSSGLGNYARTLVKSLYEYYPDNTYTLFTPRHVENEFTSYISGQKGIEVKEPESFIDKKLRSRWRSYGITDVLNEKHIDVYHGLSNELPFNISNFKGKKIVTTHDLIFMRYPKLYPFIDRKIYNKKFRHACDSADVIIAISEETKRDIEHFYFVPENKIKVIYQSCDPVYYEGYTEEETNGVIRKHNLPENFILYVGTIEERKNLLTIVKALKDVKDIPLVVVGNKRSYYDRVIEYIKDHNMQERVIFPENVTNEELPSLYRKAMIFVFPSVYEGFGIPIIEALTSRTPVITSKGSCFPEAGGPDSIYVDPHDEQAMAESIRQLISSEKMRKEMAEKGFAYSKRFHPAVISNQLMELYNS